MRHLRFIGLSLLVTASANYACDRSRSSDTSSAVTITAESHSCYSLTDFQLCIPHPGRDRVIVAKSHLSETEVTMALSKFTYAGESSTRAIQLGPDTYDVTSLFPSFISSRFNTLVNFSGPNCYNTSLLASGGLPADDIRYISLEEFDQILSLRYEEVSADEAKFGDIVVYDAKMSREHVALYLGQGMIFHKKGVMKGYGYRITGIDTAYDYEPGEWSESPVKMFLLPADTEVIKAPRAFYRLKSGDAPDILGHPVARFIEQVRTDLLESAPNWRVHKDFGIISEGTLSQAKKFVESHPIGDLNLQRLSVARVTSLRDQIYLSIDETLFRTPRGMTRRDEIMSEFCYKEESKVLGRMISGIANIVRPEIEFREAELTEILQTIGTYDKGKCEIPMFQLIQKSLAN